MQLQMQLLGTGGRLQVGFASCRRELQAEISPMTFTHGAIALCPGDPGPHIERLDRLRLFPTSSHARISILRPWKQKTWPTPS